MRALKLKAAMKNPDEFYFAMHRKKTNEGVHELDGTERLPHDVIQVSEGNKTVLVLSAFGAAVPCFIRMAGSHGRTCKPSVAVKVLSLQVLYAAVFVLLYH